MNGISKQLAIIYDKSTIYYSSLEKEYMGYPSTYYIYQGMEEFIEWYIEARRSSINGM